MAKPTAQRRLWIKPAIGLLIVVASVIIYRFTPLREFLTTKAIIEWVERMHDHPAASLIFVGVYFMACFFAPLAIFPIAGGVLFGFWKGLILNSVAANAGAWVMFLIARKLGRTTVEKLARHSLKSIDKTVARHGLWNMTLTRFAGFPPFPVTSYAAGLSEIKARDYILGTFLGTAMWTAAVTYFADTLWQAVKKAGSQSIFAALGKFFWPVLAIAIALRVAAAVGIYLKNRRSKQ